MKKILIKFTCYLLSKLIGDVYKIKPTVDDYIYGEGYTQYFHNLHSKLSSGIICTDLKKKWDSTPEATKYKTCVIRHKTLTNIQ